METHENIAYLREKLGLSQEELAELVGYKDRSSVAKVEAGKVDLSQSKIAAFAKALHVTPAQLMGMEPPPSDPVPHASYREILSEGGIRLLLDEDANVPTENIEDIIKYIKLRQGQVGR